MEMNIVKDDKNWTQVCVWEGTVLGDTPSSEFEEWVQEQFKCRARFIAQVETLPGEGGPGGRQDLFFYVHSEDVGKFAVPRLAFGIRWWEDVLGNGHAPIYPAEVLEALRPTWDYAGDQLPGDGTEEPFPESPKPVCKLVGTDGNVFAIIGKVKDTLRRAGQKDKAEEFQQRATNAGSYDEVLAMLFDYVEVE